MSNRLTFSLASLVLIFALAFVTTLVMADNDGTATPPGGATADHGTDGHADQTAANTAETTNADHMHPVITLTPVDGDSVTPDIQVIPTAETTAVIANADSADHLTIEFPVTITVPANAYDGTTGTDAVAATTFNTGTVTGEVYKGNASAGAVAHADATGTSPTFMAVVTVTLANDGVATTTNKAQREAALAAKDLEVVLTVPHNIIYSSDARGPYAGQANIPSEVTLTLVDAAAMQTSDPVVGMITGTASLTDAFAVTITFPADMPVVLTQDDIKVDGGFVQANSLSASSVTAPRMANTIWKAIVVPYPDTEMISVTIDPMSEVATVTAGMDDIVMRSKPSATLNTITAGTGADDSAAFLVTLTFAEALPANVQVEAADLKVTPATATIGRPSVSPADPTMWSVQITPTAGMDTVIELSDAGKVKFAYSGAALTVSKAMEMETGDGMIAANGFAIISRAAVNGITSNRLDATMPDLQRFFAQRGSITLHTTDTTIKAKDVVISEIMWGLDLSAAVANRKDHQWIELYNATGAAIDLSKLTLQYDQSFALPTLPTGTTLVDQISNVEHAGWTVDQGQNGSLATGQNVVAVNLVSMYRNINYDHVKTWVDKTGALNRGERNKGIPNGRAKGSWITSNVSDIYATNRIGSPGMQHIRIGADYGPTSVARSPLIITEVGNLAGEAHDWIELTALANVNLEKYELQYVKPDGTLVVLAKFVKKELKAGEILLVLGTNPANAGHPVAAGKEWKLGDADREDTGTNSLYHVDAKMKLPDAIGKATFIVRSESKTNHEKIVDIAGNLFVANSSAAYRTNLWPLRATAAGHGNVIDGDVEDFNAGRAYQRNDRGSGVGEKDWNTRGYTGVGYDRLAPSGSSPGTPGFANGDVKEKSSDLTAASVTISEVMYERVGNTPQWIELYNNSKTQGINLNEWKLKIENPREDTDVDIRSTPTLQFGGVHIPPNQTVLIVSASTGQNSGQFPAHRVIDLWKDKRSDLEVANVGRNYQLLSTSAFKLTLMEKGGAVVDTVGNLGAAKAWDLPVSEEGRGSIIRNFASKVAVDGTRMGGWHHASDGIPNPAPQHIYYGRRSDMGTPGFRIGGPLPVSLSKFRPERLDDGTIVVRWITESELNNAGFNILRSEARDGEFTKLNTKLIAGHGTTSERHTYEYADTSAKPNVVYYYQIQDVSLEGQVTTLRTTHLRGNVSAAGKLTTTWGELKALQ